MAFPLSDEREPPLSPARSHDYRRPVGDRLKTMFGDLAREPVPDRLRQLAEALDEAMQRGEVGRGKPS